MVPRPALLALLLSSGCPKETQAPENLASEARRALAERDRRLASYLVEATTTQGDQVATHTFLYRAPNRVKGTVTAPTPLTLAFDGRRFFKLAPAEKKLEAYEMKLPQEKAALFLMTQFGPFVPEGYRTPLLPTKGVTAKRVAHPKAADAVELVVTMPEQTPPMVITWHLRLPSGDFLGKKTRAGEQDSELVVEEEHCDAARGLCVPKVVVQREGGKEVGRTTFTRIALGAEVANDAFTLAAPEGFTLEPHELVESGKD